MKSIEEQISDKCIHFTGLGNKVCDAGVEYDSVKTKSTSPYKIPCLRNCQMSGGFYGCDKQHFPTEEEIKTEVEEINKLLDNRSQYTCNADCQVNEGECCHPDHCQKKLKE